MTVLVSALDVVVSAEELEEDEVVLEEAVVVGVAVSPSCSEEHDAIPSASRKVAPANFTRLFIADTLLSLAST